MSTPEIILVITTVTTSIVSIINTIKLRDIHKDTNGNLSVLKKEIIRLNKIVANNKSTVKKK